MKITFCVRSGKKCKIWWAPVLCNWILHELQLLLLLPLSPARVVSILFFRERKSNWKLLHFWHDHCWLVWMQQYLNSRCNLIKNSISISVWIFKMYSKKRNENRTKTKWSFASWSQLLDYDYIQTNTLQLHLTDWKIANKKWTCKLLFFFLSWSSDASLYLCLLFLCVKSDFPINLSHVKWTRSLLFWTSETSQ